MKLFLSFTLFFTILLVPSALCVGVSPPELKYTFVPNMSGEATFYFRNNLERDITIVPSLSGELKEYARYYDDTPIRLAPDERGTVTVKFRLPESIGEPGWHSLGIVATESEGTGGNVGARGEVTVFIRFFVQYPGKYLKATLDASDAKLNEDVKLKVTLSNLGKEDIDSASAKIEIYSEGKKIDQVFTDSTSVKVGETKNLETKWSSIGQKKGTYFAKAIINYDNKSTEANDTFKIGTFHLRIINFTNKAESNKINDFEMFVENEWNENVENIFADVNILSGNALLRTFSLAEARIKPWEIKKIKGYFDAKGIKPGIYDLNIKMTYGSYGKTETTIENGTIEIIEKKEISIEEEKSSKITFFSKQKIMNTTNVLIALIILLVIVNIILLVKKKRKDEEEKEEN
ncbi:MAG: CARDB domain-containing protein [Candidatus Woesearchaeota archaeon]